MSSSNNSGAISTSSDGDDRARLNDEHRRLLEENRNIRQKIAYMEAVLSTDRHLLYQAVAQMTQATSSAPQSPVASTSKSAVDDALVPYVEDQNGIPVDRNRLSEMRNFSRAFWSRLAEAGRAPRRWEEAALEDSSQYRRELCHRFPEFRLCADDWKSEQFATDNYPKWAASYRGQA